MAKRPKEYQDRPARLTEEAALAMKQIRRRLRETGVVLGEDTDSITGEPK